MPQLAKWVNGDLLKGFTVPQVAQKHGWLPQVAQKHGWPELLVWSRALVNKDEIGGKGDGFNGA